jgi:hypothetical protein
MPSGFSEKGHDISGPALTLAAMKPFALAEKTILGF